MMKCKELEYECEVLQEECDLKQERGEMGFGRKREEIPKIGIIELN